MATTRIGDAFQRKCDKATAELMTRFYKKILVDDMTPAEALRATQLEMVNETQWK